MKFLLTGHKVISSRARGRMNISNNSCTDKPTDQGGQQRESQSQSQRETDVPPPLGGSCRIK